MPKPKAPPKPARKLEGDPPYTQPRGRPKKGHAWDKMRGRWTPNALAMEIGKISTATGREPHHPDMVDGGSSVPPPPHQATQLPGDLASPPSLSSIGGIGGTGVGTGVGGVGAGVGVGVGVDGCAAVPPPAPPPEGGYQHGGDWGPAAAAPTAGSSQTQASKRRSHMRAGPDLRVHIELPQHLLHPPTGTGTQCPDSEAELQNARGLDAREQLEQAQVRLAV